MKSKTLLAASCAILFALIVGVMAWTYMETRTIPPFVVGNAYTEANQVGTFDYAYKIDPFGNGVYVATFPDGHTNTITISNYDGDHYFDWSSTYPISAVIVKAAQEVNVFFYDPPATSDTGLYAPLGPKGKPREVSHATFCWNRPVQEYSIETCFGYYRGYAINFIGNGFMRWGWTNPLPGYGDYTFEMWAGAGKCDLSKGTQVGTVTIHYSATGVTWDFNWNPRIVVQTDELGNPEIHVYAGKAMFPTGPNGKPTVAPGQYYIEPNLSGPIYVIVHAKVGIPIP